MQHMWQQRPASFSPKCQELGWSCIPLVVDTFGNWGKEAHLPFSRLASHFANNMSSLKPSILADIYGRLNITLVRSIAMQSHPGKGAAFVTLCTCIVALTMYLMYVYVLYNKYM